MDWHARYRRIIDAYRIKLMEISPSACNAVDDRMWKAGEKWVCDDRPIDLDRFMTAQEIAERFGLEVHDIRNWARRSGTIGTLKAERKVYYRLRDVLAYRGNR